MSLSKLLCSSFNVRTRLRHLLNGQSGDDIVIITTVTSNLYMQQRSLQCPPGITSTKRYLQACFLRRRSEPSPSWPINLDKLPKKPSSLLALFASFRRSLGRTTSLSWILNCRISFTIRLNLAAAASLQQAYSQHDIPNRKGASGSIISEIVWRERSRSMWMPLECEVGLWRDPLHVKGGLSLNEVAAHKISSERPTISGHLKEFFTSWRYTVSRRSSNIYFSVSCRICRHT
jgi:hypothetical protein